MYKHKKGQINVRLDMPNFEKLKELSRADNRSMANYASIIVEEFLKGKYRPRKRKKGTKHGNQTKQTNHKNV